MTERPILFSGPMVRAILSGQKIMTRRIMKPQPYISHTNPPTFSDTERGDIFICPDCFPTTNERKSVIVECEGIGVYHCMGEKEFAEKHSPYGRPSDLLWVREAHYLTDDGHNEYVVYAADTDATRAHLARLGALPADFPEDVKAGHRRLRPSIHMPRWASRITLEITDVHVERLGDISDTDVDSEGVEGHYVEDGWYWRNYLLSDEEAAISPMLASATESFRSLWEKINGAGSWDVNPWVWVVKFRRVRP